MVMGFIGMSTICRGLLRQGDKVRIYLQIDEQEERKEI